VLVQSLKLFSEVIILGEGNLNGLKNDTNPIVLPDEELNHHFADAYLKGKDVTFVSAFLRWDKKISTTEFEVSPDRVISEAEFDKEMIARAGKEAERSPDWWRQIGAVLVRDKKPLLTAYNKVLPSEYSINTFGDPRSNFDAGDKQAEYIYKTIHAEAAVIAEAAKQGISTDGTSLYITTFPCAVCARSIVTAGIKEVYYAKGYSALDAEDILRAFNIKITMVK
jgi:dCMP deaminase